LTEPLGLNHSALASTPTRGDNPAVRFRKGNSGVLPTAASKAMATGERTCVPINSIEFMLVLLKTQQKTADEKQKRMVKPENHAVPFKHAGLQPPFVVSRRSVSAFQLESGGYKPRPIQMQ
jgi:hypothetical protein